jgi:signal transduction histidine kinase
MSVRFHQTLGLKLFLSFLVVTAVSVLTVVLVHRNGIQRHIRQQIHQESVELGRGYSELVAGWIEAGRVDELSSRLQVAQATTRFIVSLVGFRSDLKGLTPNLLDLTVEERDVLLRGQEVSGSTIGRLSSENYGVDPSSRGSFVAIPVIVNGESVGAVVIYHLRPGISRRAESEARALRDGVIAALLSALALSLLLARNLTRPIRQVTDSAEQLASGDFTIRTGLDRSDEVGVLAETFDKMATEIESSIANRSRLLSDVSHELATPVTTIRATLESMLDGLVAEDEKEQYLRSLLNQTEYLSCVVHDVTELSRFETGEIKIAKQPFCARVPASRAMEAALVLAQRKNIELQSVEPDSDLQVVGDVHRITQVLTNLLVNAIHHNPEGTRVLVSWRLDKERVRFEVHDNGLKIPEPERERLFERFYKLSESRTPDGSGAGLGLAIVQDILKAHESQLHLVQEGDGKSFIFSLDNGGDQGHAPCIPG